MYHYNADPGMRLKAFAKNVAITLATSDDTGVGVNTVSPTGYAVHEVLQARHLLYWLRRTRNQKQIAICESIIKDLEAKAAYALAEYGVEETDMKVEWERRRERSLAQ